YLDARPGGHFVSEASKRLKKLRAAADQREPRDFDSAWERGTSAAWDEYFAQHPDSSRRAEARRCRDEAVAFEAALAANTASLWRAFMKAWPEGRHRLDAELRVRGARSGRRRRRRSCRRSARCRSRRRAAPARATRAPRTRRRRIRRGSGRGAAASRARRR